MLVFKKLRVRDVLSRALRRDPGTAAAKPGRTPRLSYADVRLSSLGLALQRQGSFDEWLRGPAHD
ncbi:hypothetical protein GALL_285880 [mine drainage metagenome]|uniref:Uncharacterized protein n=1 Tax=mine drainage metagenome TaxID=410659 RepID=A0A1J5RBW3_9ZZZZ